MIIYKDTDLKPYNTFNVSGKASYVVHIEAPEDIQSFMQNSALINKDTFILGGGSNLLFTRDFNGVLLHSTIKEIEVVNENSEEVLIKCGSGVNWDSFVDFCTQNNWGGIENLSDIPGNVGAAPVQNIGAYGVEAKDVIERVEGLDYTTGKAFSYNNTECKFGYRNSIFKSETRKFITHVIFKLSKKHTLITNYGKVKEELSKFDKITIHSVREVIVNIRRSKLPPLEELGSGGSFFKNPVVENDFTQALLNEYPDMPNYPQPENRVKLSAAWLIDTAGLKGIERGNVATYFKQPLVIVNKNNASGEEIADFARFIQDSVNRKFNIMLEPEVIFK
jgi:UDP-N-acetylmuramate dehydrogenase